MSKFGNQGWLRSSSHLNASVTLTNTEDNSIRPLTLTFIVFTYTTIKHLPF